MSKYRYTENSSFMGAAIVDSSLINLTSSNLNNKIASVHLLGAAISNSLMANNTLLGNATERIVDKFYNLYNPEDDGLRFNQLSEKHDPLGLVRAPSGTVHVNYTDTNVAYEIPPSSDANGDGNVEECFEEIQLTYGETITVDILVLEILLQGH
jgi:hypothetical protein